MADLIDRQTAIDAVCMEWCGIKHQDCEHPFDIEKDDYYWCDGCETALRTLPDLPSAQPEIVRCKECKKQDIDNVFRSMWCYEMQVFVKPNEFCSRAERRADAAD